MDSTTHYLINSKVLVTCQIQEDLRQFIRCIVVEMNRLCESALQTRVRVNKIMHLVGIASHDTDKLATIILQTFQKRIDSLSTKRISIIRLQGISLINEEYTTQSLIYQLIGLNSRLSGIACH